MPADTARVHARGRGGAAALAGAAASETARRLGKTYRLAVIFTNQWGALAASFSDIFQTLLQALQRKNLIAAASRDAP